MTTVYAERRTLMVDTQVRPSDVTKFTVLDAMLSVPREAYVPNDMRDLAYIDGNIPLGQDRVILEPRTAAKMLDHLNVQPDEVVLDIGCGLGYSTAVLAHLAEAVVAVESDDAMAAEAQSILSEQGVDNAAVMGGALADGAPNQGLYDVIVIQGGVQVVPDGLEAQLKDGGRIAAVFMDGALGTVRIGYKLDGRMNWRFAFHASAPVLDGFFAQGGFAL